MYIERDLERHLKTMATQFPVVALLGPRQSGKTTMAKKTFPDYTYVSLEDLDLRMIAKEDPRGFLAAHSLNKGVIIDEIQEVPELLSYMQGIVDQSYKPGFFIITGSQNFLLYEKISQTLAGRIALLTLLPLSIHELTKASLLPSCVEELLIKGEYPRIYAQPIDPEVWRTNYINTYIEKDVRQILQISNVIQFQKFIKLCAARIGNLVNYSDLARDADISPNTAKAWLSILESSYIIKLLYPYYKNFNKRVIKSPKLYFYDTGLACSLLGIKNAEELAMHPFKGALFESLVISELFKFNFNKNSQPSLYFWRDVQGHEIDILIEKSIMHLIPIEIKASQTVTHNFFKGVSQWHEITSQSDTSSYIVYGGEQKLFKSPAHIYSWSMLHHMLEKIYS